MKGQKNILGGPSKNGPDGSFEKMFIRTEEAMRIRSDGSPGCGKKAIDERVSLVLPMQEEDVLCKI